MQWTGLNELREKFLTFFEQKGHYRFNSFPLVPQEDKSLLLINSGMAPLKKYFLQQETVPGNTATSCQKCIRTPDIERVGITARHGTFFEMLGNFSFAAYFKKEATAYAYEFFTEVLDIPLERLYFSVYEQDDEAYDIWTKDIGVPESHMVRFGKEDNFWEIGAGPCGPCSEIYFDRGLDHGCGKPDCKVGCDCDRFIEVWNLVFTQFISDGNGNYEKMEHGNIDTGMGLERLACIMQGVDNLFETDTLRSIITETEKLSGYKYKTDDKNDISVRVITDHIRSTVFLVGDGVMPSNEGRGYVLRRLLRRAARHGRLLGIKGAFLAGLSETVIELNRTSYPELHENKDYIKKVIAIEEERFAKTIDSGYTLLTEEIAKHKAGGKNTLSGDVAFKLSDTFGFPLDLTVEILSEQGMEVDRDGFAELLQKQKDTARSARAGMGDASWTGELFADLNLPATNFVGYASLCGKAEVLAVALSEQDDCNDIAVVLDSTPFYAESGGQVGDAGVIEFDGGLIEVADTTKLAGGVFLHRGKLASGMINRGDIVTASVDKKRRKAITRNHTSAHLLQQALIAALGDHVHQAGSYVSPTRVRFDFTHFSPMTPQEIALVEQAVNEQIFENLEVVAQEMPIEQAKKLGAQALFGEKYGDVVRVVTCADYSTEFCGGCHVSNTSQIGAFKILSESSVAAGVRRIEGTTGLGVLQLLTQREELLNNSAALLKLNSFGDLPQKLTALISENKEKDAVIAAMKSSQADSQLDAIKNSARTVGEFTLLCGLLKDTDGNTLRECAAKLKDDNSIVLLIGQSGDKIAMAASCGSAAVSAGKGAGALIKAVAKQFGGNGGGKPDFAMGGLRSAEVVKDVIEQLPGIVGEL